MAKQLFGGKVSTDEDWYEVDAFGKRSGRRFLNGEGDPNAGLPTDKMPNPMTMNATGGGMDMAGAPGAGGGAGGAAPVGTFQTSALPALKNAIQNSQPGGAGMMQMTAPGGNPQLGNRILPMQELRSALTQRRIY